MVTLRLLSGQARCSRERWAACQGTAAVTRPAYQKLVLEQCPVTNLDAERCSLCDFKCLSSTASGAAEASCADKRGTRASARGQATASRGLRIGLEARGSGRRRPQGRMAAGLLLVACPDLSVGRTGEALRYPRTVLRCRLSFGVTVLFAFSLPLPGERVGGLYPPFEDLGKPRLAGGAALGACGSA